MKRSTFDWVGNIVFFIGVLLMNTLANALPIAGMSTGAISDKYDNLFTPAGFIFSIWGLIYLFLALFIIYQALPGQRENQKIASISTLFKVNNLANILWIFAWHYELMVVSFFLMLIILVTLIQIYRTVFRKPPFSLSQMLMLYLPFSLYLAWIIVATIANISALQVAYNLEDILFSAFDWVLIKLAIACVISIILLWRRGDVIFSLVSAWASYGIFIKHAENIAVSNAAYMVCVILVMLSIYYAYLQLRIKVE
jgi:hypothetical protein